MTSASGLGKGMKGRESGMPPKDTWDSFFNPTEVLDKLGLDNSVEHVVEFGCGYGTFTIPAARVAKGIVHAIDLEPEMIQATQRAADGAGLRNIHVILRDFAAEGTGLKIASMDYAMLFNILHIEHPQKLLREAWRVLRDSGKLGIIHWLYDSTTPRGPSMEIRPKPEQCIAWAKEAGFAEPLQCDLPPYHYGIVMRKGGIE